LDTAHHYNNQLGVAAGLTAAGVRNTWVTSKVEACNTSFASMGSCVEDTRKRFLEDLEQLNASSVDLMLLHSPTSNNGAVYGHMIDCSDPVGCEAMQQQWKVLEEFYNQGKTRSIGVSNYCVQCLECLAQNTSFIPMVNQIRIHVGMDLFSTSASVSSNNIVKYCQEKGIAAQAYSPLARGNSKLLNNEDLKKYAAIYNVSTAQVALRYLLQHDLPVVTRTDAASFMHDDLNVFNWALSDTDMAKLDSDVFMNESVVWGRCIE
jgi:diketogulonate reductase-like aldo/keto reductase